MQNLTPHPITLRMPDGTERTIEPSGTVARVTMSEDIIGTMAGVQLVRRRPGVVEGLIRDERGVIEPCIVSSLVLAALPSGTLNAYAPDTGPTAIRDERGQVVAVTRLVSA